MILYLQQDMRNQVERRRYFNYLNSNKFFSKLGNILFVKDNWYSLYLFDGKNSLFKKLGILSDDFRFCVELPIKMEISNMNSCIPSYEFRRIAGKKR